MELTHRGVTVHPQRLQTEWAYWNGVRSGRISIYDE